MEREQCVLDLLDDAGMTRERFIAAFLEPPLRNTNHAQGFGTLYTAAYFRGGRAEYRWPGFTWRQSFDRFEESEHVEVFERSAARRRATAVAAAGLIAAGAYGSDARRLGTRRAVAARATTGGTADARCSTPSTAVPARPPHAGPRRARVPRLDRRALRPARDGLLLP